MITIRPLNSDDRTAWQPLWEGYLRFYRATLDPSVTDGAFARLTGADPALTGLVAVNSDDRVIGFAHLIFHPSTWSPADSCYLNDLFVSTDGRGSGAGRALIDAVYAEAAARGADNVYWHTQEFNAPARKLYESVATLTSFRVYEHEL